MALSKIQAESMNLADTYAFSGTVSGTSAFEKVSSSTSTTSGISSLTIDLPTTTDFIHLRLILRGLKCASDIDNYWAMRVRNVGGSIITSSSYSYLQNYNYSNDSSNASVPWNDINATSVDFAGYAGDGDDDAEMTSLVIDLEHSASTDRYTRGYFKKSIEQRRADTYHYNSYGSFYVSTNSALDQIQIFAHTTPNFTTYGYALYKVML